MQLAPNVGAIAEDLARPNAVLATQNLLAGGGDHSAPALAEMAPGQEAVLVVAPEFAFGSTDWTAIDAAVRQSSRPLVFIAGFGATIGQALIDWRDATGPEVVTRRHFAWNQVTDAIGGVRPVNGGWCWVHHPKIGTHCLVFLKTIPEQSVEAVELPALQFGHTVTHLRFADVDLFPLICADLLQPIAPHPDSAQARIREVLTNGVPTNRPAMVVGSLLQRGYNENWEIAIDSLLNQVMVDRPGLVALCNISYDQPVADESRDRWRSLTGIYGKWGELTKGQQNLPVSRRLNVRGIVGAVVRHSDPTVSTGKVDWGPYGPIDGKFIWHAEMHSACGTDGITAPIKLPSGPEGCELSRFIRRHPPEPKWSPRLANGLTGLSKHIASGAEPNPRRLLEGLLAGVTPAAVDPDNLHEVLIQPAAVAAVHSLAVVSTIQGIEWQSNNDFIGQLRLDSSNRNILIWRDPRKTSGQMRSELGAWRLGASPHPDLIVIGASRLGDLDAGVIVEHRRDDVAAAPPPALNLGATGALAAETSDITRPRGKRNVAALGLAEVAKIYAEFDPAQGDAVSVEKLISAINSFFSEGEAA